MKENEELIYIDNIRAEADRLINRLAQYRDEVVAGEQPSASPKRAAFARSATDFNRELTAWRGLRKGGSARGADGS